MKIQWCLKEKLKYNYLDFAIRYLVSFNKIKVLIMVFA